MNLTVKIKDKKLDMFQLQRKEFGKYLKYNYLTLMFLPGVIFYVLFHYVPLYGIQIAFRDYQFTAGMWGSPWVGLNNFKELFALGSFWNVFRNTLTISFYKLVFGFPAPIIFAILLNEITAVKYKKFVQTVSYLPHFLSWVVLGGVFIQFLSPSTGPINLILKLLEIKPIYFLGDYHWFRFTLVATEVWKGFGWGSIIYIATITGIDVELYEAATVDGTNRFQNIFYITLPALAPVITIMLIFAVGGLINDDFDQVFNLYNEAVLNVGDVLGTYTYRVGLVKMQYSFATTVGLFKNLIAFALILVTNSITKKINEYGIW